LINQEGRLQEVTTVRRSDIEAAAHHKAASPRTKERLLILLDKYKQDPIPLSLIKPHEQNQLASAGLAPKIDIPA
jgi:hypothetical protein